MKIFISSREADYYEILGVCNKLSRNNLLEMLLQLRFDSFIILISLKRYDLIKKHWDFFNQIDSDMLGDMLHLDSFTLGEEYQTRLYFCLVVNHDEEIAKFIESRLDKSSIDIAEYWAPGGTVTEDNCWSHFEVMCRTKNFKKIPIKLNNRSAYLVSSLLFKYNAIAYTKNIIMMIDDLEVLKTLLHSIAAKRLSADKLRLNKSIDRSYKHEIDHPIKEILIPGTFESIVWNFIEMSIEELRLQCRKVEIKTKSTDKLTLIRYLTKEIF